MKILFVYFSKKQMCETVEQAVEFINGLKYRNLENQPNLVVNDRTMRFLKEAFAQEWKMNEVGRPYIIACDRMHTCSFEIATTGCRLTRIYGYYPLADTVEEHDAIVAERERAQREADAKRYKEEREERLAELNHVRRGWYHVELDIKIVVPGRMNFADTTFTGNVIADSGADAYIKAKAHFSSRHNLVRYHGQYCEIFDCSAMESGGYNFIFLGMKTDEGYSVEKWEDFMEGEGK